MTTVTPEDDDVPLRYIGTVCRREGCEEIIKMMAYGLYHTSVCYEKDLEEGKLPT
jgi:hypothetical protein